MFVLLYVIALVFEVLGLATAWIGFRQTWARHGDETQTLRAAVVAPVRQWLRARWLRVESAARRLFRRPKNATINVPVASVSRTAVSAHASGRVSYAALPSIADAPEAFAAEVERRLAEVLERSQDTQNDLVTEARDRTNADDKLRTDLTEQTNQVEELARDVAVDGLVLQGRGWVLVFIGVVLGSSGNIAQALLG